MILDIPALVAPLSEGVPSGPDLAYDDERIEIESAFERPISVDGVDSSGVDWPKVIDRITAQSARTRDIWLPVYLIRAAAFSKQFDLLVEAAELLAALLETRWDDVHPQLDEYGFVGRTTPCESLTRIGDFLAPLARVPLLEHARFGKFTGQDFIRFAEKGAGADGLGQFRATIDSVTAESLNMLGERFEALCDAFKRVDAVLTVNALGDTATNFSPTHAALDRIRAALGVLLPGQKVPSEDGMPNHPGRPEIGVLLNSENVTSEATEAARPFARQGLPMEIRNREDVVRALDAICAYYAAYEPGSPVPLVLRRAREWTELDFLSILQDIAPSNLEEAVRVLRSSRSEPMKADGLSPVAGIDGVDGDAGGGWSADENPPADSGW